MIFQRDKILLRKSEYRRRVSAACHQHLSTFSLPVKKKNNESPSLAPFTSHLLGRRASRGKYGGGREQTSLKSVARQRVCQKVFSAKQCHTYVQGLRGAYAPLALLLFFTQKIKSLHPHHPPCESFILLVFCDTEGGWTLPSGDGLISFAHKTHRRCRQHVV